MKVPSRKAVKEIYRKHFRTSSRRGPSRWEETWMQTWEELLPEADPETLRRERDARYKTTSLISTVQEEVALEEEDEYAIAMAFAFDGLRRDAAVQAAQKAFAGTVRAVLATHKRHGPKDWRPKSLDRETDFREARRLVEEGKFGLLMILYFDRMGGYLRWTISSTIPSDAEEEGPTAALRLTESFGDADLLEGVKKALLRIDWKEVEEALRG